MLLWFGGIVLIFGAIAAIELIHFGALDSSVSPAAPLYDITLDNVNIHVMIADTIAAQQQGLGGLASLPEDEGMLFVFPTAAKYGFWMKDMLFSIDILWAAEDGSIVYIKKNVSPSTYPGTFTPDKAAKYVLEVPSGFADEHQVQLGDIIHLQ